MMRSAKSPGASETYLSGILDYVEDEVVSSDLSEIHMHRSLMQGREFK